MVKIDIFWGEEERNEPKSFRVFRTPDTLPLSGRVESDRRIRTKAIMWGIRYGFSADQIEILVYRD